MQNLHQSQYCWQITFKRPLSDFPNWPGWQLWAGHLDYSSIVCMPGAEGALWHIIQNYKIISEADEINMRYFFKCAWLWVFIPSLIRFSCNAVTKHYYCLFNLQQSHICKNWIALEQFPDTYFKDTCICWNWSNSLSMHLQESLYMAKRLIFRTV